MPLINKCAFCLGPMPPRKWIGRPRIYCTDRCQQAAKRRRRRDLIEGMLAGASPRVHVGMEITPEDLLGPRARDPDELVVQSIIEARTVAAGFGMAAARARPELAWRCEKMADHIAAGLARYFRPPR